MSSLFGSKKAPSAQTGPTIASGLSLQSSSYARPIPLIFGANRASVNIFYYNDFTPVPHFNMTGGGGGGKGGVFGGSKSNNFSVEYTYKVAVMLAVCEGPINGYGTVYADKSQTSTASVGLSEFLGTYPQTPWTYLTTNHPADAYHFPGIAYLAGSQYDLGSSPNLPNHNVEVYGLGWHSVSVAVPDADPSYIVTQLLTNTKFGVTGFSSWLGSLTTYQNYCFATGLFLSPIYDSQQPAASLLEEIAMLTNSEISFPGGTLTLIPRGDESATANGRTYTPPSVVYALGDDDFLPTSGKGGSVASPIVITRERPSDWYNHIRMECLNRNNQYQKITVERKDQASIDLYGLRQSPVISAHCIADPVIAGTICQLLLQRQGIRNIYHFSTSLKYMNVEPMDILTLTHAGQQLTTQGVRVRRINKRGATFDFECEEYLPATGTAAQYSLASGGGYAVNYDEPPGNVNTPIVFEPTFDLAGAMEIWAGLSGVDTTNWGGCEVWASYDNSQYSLVTTVNVASRMGVLTAVLPPIAGTSPTQDNVNTLSVNVSQSAAQLISVSQADELAGNSLCYVDGEYLSYRTSVLTGSGQYNLTQMLRGMYGTTGLMSGSSHPIGSKFLRLDGRVAKIPYDQTRIGATVYLKFLSFNTFGQAKQSLADVSPTSYVIQGLMQGVTTVQSFVVAPVNVDSNNGGYVPGILCTWDPVTNSSAVAVLIEFFPAGSPDQTTQEYCNDPASGSYTIMQGLQPNTQYYVRATIIMDPSLLPSTYTNYSLVTTGGELTTNPSPGAVAAPTGLVGVGAIRTIALTWTNPTIGGGQVDPDLDHVEVVYATSNDRNTALLGGTSTTDGFVLTGLNPNTTYYFWIRSYNRSNTASAYFPASPTAGVQVTTAQVGTADLIAGAVTADKIAAGTITGDRIAGNTITGNKMVAKTLTAAVGAIDDLAVDTLQLAGQSVIVPTVQILSDTITNPFNFQVVFNNISNGSITFTAPIGAVVTVFATWTASLSWFGSPGANSIYDLYLNGVLACRVNSLVTSSSVTLTGAITVVGTGAPQSVVGQVNVGITLHQIQNRSLFLMGAKR